MSLFKLQYECVNTMPPCGRTSLAGIRLYEYAYIFTSDIRYRLAINFLSYRRIINSNGARFVLPKIEKVRGEKKMEWKETRYRINKSCEMSYADFGDIRSLSAVIVCMLRFERFYAANGLSVFQYKWTFELYIMKV